MELKAGDNDHRSLGGSTLTAAVIVPTYRRPASLELCLRSLSAQTRRPDRVVVVTRPGDGLALNTVRQMRHELPCIEHAVVAEAGQVAAISAGLARCREHIVAHTDDDAAPFPDWVERLLAHYGPGIGAVGGRDLLPAQHHRRPPRSVGKITWFGRMHGNHHLGEGPPREVDVLKAVNMSMRRELWRLDLALHGEGAQTHMEVGLCLQARRDGWRLIYDPRACVRHNPAPRFDENDRERPTLRARGDVEFNYAYQLGRHLPAWRVPIAALYLLAAGTRWAPGLVAWIEAVFSDPRQVRPTTATFAAVTVARLRGLRSGVVRRGGQALVCRPSTRTSADPN